MEQKVVSSKLQYNLRFIKFHVGPGHSMEQKQSP